jgi:hypothetical protein
MKQAIIGLFFLLPLLGAAQVKHAIKFTNITQIGMLSGKTEQVPSVQTINGIAVGPYSIGLGAGYDSYGHKSVPLFLDTRRAFGRRKVKLLVYADGGLNLPLRMKSLPEKWDDGNIAYQFNRSLYAEGGLGISNRIGKHSNMQLTIGYSYKHFSYTEHSQLWYSMPYTYSVGNATYNYYYRRFSLRLGLQL